MLTKLLMIKMKTLSVGEIPANRLVCLFRFEKEKHSEVYIIPAKAWEKPNDLLKKYEMKKYMKSYFDMINQKKDVEEGINV